MVTLTFIACAINKQIVLFRPASPINDMSTSEGLYYYSWNGSQTISASNGRGGEILWHMQSPAAAALRGAAATRRGSQADDAIAALPRAAERQGMLQGETMHAKDRRRVPPTRHPPPLTQAYFTARRAD